MPASTQTPEIVNTPTSQPSKACDTPSYWTIRFNRSGGFAGFDETMTLDSGGSLEVQSERPPTDEQRTISEDQVDSITKLLAQACPFKIEPEKGVCADCFVYDLDIQMDDRSYTLQASDVTLTDDLGPLIGALSQLLQGTE
jgi:hypothetical protein